MLKKDETIQRLMDEYTSWTAQGRPDNQAGSTAAMTSELHPYDAIFSPIKINKTTIKNRIVMAPMGNIDMCEETGRPSQMMLDYFFARAKGGTGLITTGLVPVSFGIDNSITELGELSYFPRIDRSRTVYCGWRDLAQGCHAYGTKVFIQLTPGLGRVGNPQCIMTQHKMPVSASFNPNFYMPNLPCWRLSDRKLTKIIKNAGQASADAMAMGLDGVYLHGHEGYLLEQLTNPAFNRRKVGRFSDWQRFGVEIVREMRQRTSPEYPIMYRIDLSLALNETYGERMQKGPLKKFTNGRTIEMTLDYMKELVKAGVDVFDVDLGCYDNWWLPHPPATMPSGCYLKVSGIVKEHFEKNRILSNAGVPVPVVGVGKLGYPDIAEQALRDGQCDMVMLGRPLLSDPDWGNKAYAGKVDQIIPCIGCQEGCLNEFVEGGHPQCAVNPRTSFEYLYPETPQKAVRKKRIAVVGAGPGGIQFALTAAGRGHKVEVFEKESRIGGKIISGSVPKIKFDLLNYLEYLERQVELAAGKENFIIHMDTEVKVEQLQQEKYDAVVFANGSRDLNLQLPGIEKIRTGKAVELFLNPSIADGAQKIVIVGGGVVGCEAAQWLYYEKGIKDIKVVEMAKYFMEGVCTANRGHLIHVLHEAGVELINCARVTGFDAGKVLISRNTHKNVPDPYVTWTPVLPENIINPLAPKVGEELREQTLDADLVLFATGGCADDIMLFETQRQNIVPELYSIGDSYAPGKVHEAVRSAYRLALTI